MSVEGLFTPLPQRHGAAAVVCLVGAGNKDLRRLLLLLLLTTLLPLLLLLSVQRSTADSSALLLAACCPNSHLEEGCLGGVHACSTSGDEHVVGCQQTHAGGRTNLVLADLLLDLLGLMGWWWWWWR